MLPAEEFRVPDRPESPVRPTPTAARPTDTTPAIRPLSAAPRPTWWGSVLVCDDRPAVRQELVRILQRPPVRVAGVASRRLAARYRGGPADVVLAHASPPGLRALTELLGGVADVAALLYGGRAELARITVPAGLWGIFQWESGGSAATLQATVAVLLRGDRAAARVGLTARELQVLKALGRGRSNVEISRELYLAEQTVKVHVRQLFRKLGVRHRAEAVAYGFRAGLID